MNIIRLASKQTAETLLKPLSPFIDSPLVTEIYINKPHEIFLKGPTLSQHRPVPPMDATFLHQLCTTVAKENHVSLSKNHPFFSGYLYNGAAIHIMMPPAAKYPIFAIRKSNLPLGNLDTSAKAGFFDRMQPANIPLSSTEDDTLRSLYDQQQWLDFIKLAIASKKNILIVGKPQSGKTTFLNTCAQHIPHYERIVSLQNADALVLPKHTNHIPLITPKAWPENHNPLSIPDFFQDILKLNPERLLVDEITGNEISHYVEAVTHHQKGSIATISAQSIQHAIQRLIYLYQKSTDWKINPKHIEQQIEYVFDVIIQVALTGNGSQATQVYFKPYLQNQFP